MTLRLAGEEFSVVQGLDGLGWLREIQAADSRPGLKIVHSGSGAALDVNRNIAYAGGYGPVVEAGASDYNLGWAGSALWLLTRSNNPIKLGINGVEKASLGADGYLKCNLGFRTQSLLLKEEWGNTWRFRNSADTAEVSVLALGVQCQSLMPSVTQGAFLGAYNSDNSNWLFKARDNGVDLAEVARLQSAVEPRFKFTLPAQMVRDAADYGGGFSSYDPGAGVEGDMKVAEDTNGGTPGRRIYVYSGGAWRYSALS